MNLSKILSKVDDIRLLTTLTKTASGLPISDTIQDLSKLLSNKVEWALCGGLAVGVHSRPRGTDDVDILLTGDSVLTYLYNLTSISFKKSTDHIIIHRQTSVSVDLVTPEYINVSSEIVHKAIQTAKSHVVGKVSIPVVNRDGLVALKLSRGKYIDLADIESIIRTNGKIDVSTYPLNDKQLETLKRIEDITLDSSTE